MIRAYRFGFRLAAYCVILLAGASLGAAQGNRTGAGAAQPAGSMTIGPATLAASGPTGFSNTESCRGIPCTYVQWQGTSADAVYASPVDGTIVEWRISSESSGGKVALRVLRPAGGGKYVATGTSASQTLTGNTAAPDAFTTSLPVKAGDLIGLDNATDALIFRPGVSGETPYHFTPPLADGAAAAAPTAPAGATDAGLQLEVDAYVIPTATTTTTTTTTTTAATTTGTSTTTTTSTTATTTTTPTTTTPTTTAASTTTTTTPTTSTTTTPTSTATSSTAATTTTATTTTTTVPLAPPVRGRVVDVQPVAGTVLVNGAPLKAGARIPVGALVNATHGTVHLTSVNGAGNFYGGAFRISEARTAGTPTTLRLRLGSRASCVTKHRASPGSPPRVLDSLWGNVKGKFVTRGRYASAAVRGTKWHTVDRCDGTLVAVSRGVVAVRDLKRKTTTNVRAGHQLLVKP